MRRPPFRPLPLLAGIALALPLASALSIAAAAQSFAQPGPYAPPSEGLRPIDLSPRAGAIPLYQPSIWEGLYLGAHLGHDFGSLWASLAPDDKLDLKGVSGGLHLGHNWQRGSIVGGFEIDADGKATDGSRSMSVPAGVVAGLPSFPLRFDGHAEWLTSARLRFGYALGSALVYGTGGYAVGEMTVRAGALGGSIKTSEVMQGYVFGAGVEMKFSPNISARVEALHYEFTEKTFNFGSTGLRGDADLTTVRAGLTYHFN